MKTIKKIVKGSIVAALAVVVMSSSAFAATGVCGYDDLSNTKSDTNFPVDCKVKINDKPVYGKNAAACSKANMAASNPGSCESSENDLNKTVKNVITAIIGVVGIIAVVMIIIGGISYATSQGDPQKVKKGKDTILYGIIGLVVALLAFAIVQFVLGAL